MRRALAKAITSLRRSKGLEEILAKDYHGASHQAEHAYVQNFRKARRQYRSPRSFSAEAGELDDGRKALERARLSSLWHQRITLLGARRAVKHDVIHPSTFEDLEKGNVSCALPILLALRHLM